MTDPFENKMISKKDPKKRVAHMSDNEYKRYSLFRALLWEAVDKKDFNFSIRETAKRLGIK